MENRKRILATAAGGLAGIFAWLLAHFGSPTAPHVLGVACGTLAASAIAACVGPTRGRKAVLSLVVAAAIGSFAGLAASLASSDFASTLTRSATSVDLVSKVAILAWQGLLGIGLGAAVGVATQAKGRRLARLLLGGLLAAAIGYTLRTTLEPIFMLMGWVTPLATASLIDCVALGLSFGFVAAGAVAASQGGAWLHLVKNGKLSDSFPVADDVVRIGRSEKADIHIPEAASSAPILARVVREGDCYFLREAEDTTVNGQPVRNHALAEGDVLQVADVTIVFTASPQLFVLMTTIHGAAGSPSSSQSPYDFEPDGKVVVSVRSHRLVDPFGRVTNLPRGKMSVGRDPGAAVALLYDRTVSRAHAEMLVHPDQAMIRDLGSTNGTYVNGQPASDWVLLDNGDEVRVGATTMTYRY